MNAVSFLPPRSRWQDVALAMTVAASLGGHLAAQSSVTPAQPADSSVTPAARLEQLDGTYSSNLRKYHAPVILDYLRELEKLHQSYVTKGSAEEAAQVQAEIDKTKKLSTSSGLLSYQPLKPEPPPGVSKPAGNEPPKGKGRRFSPDAIMLATNNATNTRPAASTLASRPDPTAIPLGHAEWRVDKVPAGVYEILLICNTIEGSEKTSMQANLGSFSVEHRLPPTPPSSPTDFRVFRVGTITFDQDLTDTTLTLESSDPAKPSVWVKNVILTHPKPPPGEGGPGKPPPPPGGGMPPGGSPPGAGPPPDSKPAPPGATPPQQ